MFCCVKIETSVTNVHLKRTVGFNLFF